MFHHLCTATYLIQLIISTWLSPADYLIISTEIEVHFLADNFERIDTLLVPTRYTFVLVLFLFLSVLLSPSVHWNLPWKLFSFKVGTTNIIKLIVKSIIIIINMGSSTLLKCLIEMRKNAAKCYQLHASVVLGVLNYWNIRPYDITDHRLFRPILRPKYPKLCPLRHQ